MINYGVTHYGVTVYWSTEVIPQFSKIFWNYSVHAISDQILVLSKSNILPWLRGAACSAQQLLQQQVPWRWLFSHHGRIFTNSPLWRNVSLWSSRKLLHGFGFLFDGIQKEFEFFEFNLNWILCISISHFLCSSITGNTRYWSCITIFRKCLKKWWKNAGCLV